MLLNICSYDLRKKLNELPCEMGQISLSSVKEIIANLEQEAKVEYERLMKLPPIHSHGGWD